MQLTLICVHFTSDGVIRGIHNLIKQPEEVTMQCPKGFPTMAAIQ
jgi:hypothetical protein